MSNIYGMWKPHENVIIKSNYWKDMIEDYYKIRLIISNSGNKSYMTNTRLIRNFRVKYWDTTSNSKMIKCEEHTKTNNMQLCRQYCDQLDDVLGDTIGGVDNWSRLEQMRREKKLNRIISMSQLPPSGNLDGK